MKKKFSLTNDLVSIEEEPRTSESHLKEKTTEYEETVTMTIRVTKNFRSEIKSWCSKNDITVRDAVQSGLLLLQKKYNKQ